MHRSGLHCQEALRHDRRFDGGNLFGSFRTECYRIRSRCFIKSSSIIKHTAVYVCDRKRRICFRFAVSRHICRICHCDRTAFGETGSVPSRASARSGVSTERDLELIRKAANRLVFDPCRRIGKNELSFGIWTDVNTDPKNNIFAH